MECIYEGTNAMPYWFQVGTVLGAFFLLWLMADCAGRSIARTAKKQNWTADQIESAISALSGGVL